MLNINESIDRRVFFTSDWHWNHTREFVWGSRGYASVNDHNKAIIESTNEVVKENDILFNLGDLILNSTIAQFEELISQIKCKNMYMLFGNHPNKHYKEIYKPLVKTILGENYTPESELYPLRYKNVVYYGPLIEAAVNGQFICFCHYPIMSWNHISSGSWMIHGHMHCNNNPTNGKILDVGWDAYKKPLSFAEVKAIMNTRAVVGDGGHHI